jgi:hypothetical protein
MIAVRRDVLWLAAAFADDTRIQSLDHRPALAYAAACVLAIVTTSRAIRRRETKR